jgi:8-oxo-dGTP pyrophosphatase MutT (NUDIX family)
MYLACAAAAAAAGETLASCAVREVMEETGVQIRNNQGALQHAVRISQLRLACRQQHKRGRAP